MNIRLELTDISPLTAKNINKNKTPSIKVKSEFVFTKNSGTILNKSKKNKDPKKPKTTL
jgi:hypothetical protein